MESKLQVKRGNVLRKIESELSTKCYSYVEKFPLPFSMIKHFFDCHEALEHEYEQANATMPKPSRRKNYLSRRIKKRYFGAHKFKTTFEDGADVYWLAQMTISKDELGVAHLSIYIRLIGFANEVQKHDILNVLYQVAILDSTGNRVYTKFSPFRQFSLEDDPCWGWQFYIPVNKLGCSRARDEIVFNVMMQILRAADVHTVISDQNFSMPAKTLPDSASTTWCTNDDWDLIVQCQNLSYRAHRSILAAASPVIANLLRINKPQVLHFNNKDREVLQVPNLEPDLVEGILEFCYTGRTKLFDEVLQCARLCELGRAWQIKGLAKEAFLQMSSLDTLKLWNFTFVFKHAVHILDQPGALKNVEEFIVKNYGELKTQAGFQELMNDHKFAVLYASIFF